MPLCAVCRRNKVSQDHHIIYEPYEIKIGVCKECHTDIHGHGTGVTKMPPDKYGKAKAIRGISDEIWKVVKVRAALENVTIGKYVSKALAMYLQTNNK